MKIIGTGLSGLIGSRITELLSAQYEFENISRKTGVDIFDSQAIFDKIKASEASIVLHLAGYTDVDGAEKEKELGENSESWKINVEGTKNVLNACEKLNKKIIYFSTDMVFPGTKEIPGKYLEDDSPSPVGFYASTKFEAEKLVENAQCPWMILRIAYPYRANFEKKDYVRFFKWLLEEGREIKAVSDHHFTPTFIDDLAPVLDLIFKNNLNGKLHAVGSETVSPYEVALKITQAFGLNEALIIKTTKADFFKDKAPRAYNLSLNNDKIVKLGIRMHSFSEGLEEIKTQL